MSNSLVPNLSKNLNPDLDILIAHRKAVRSCIQYILFPNLFPTIGRLLPLVLSLLMNLLAIFFQALYRKLLLFLDGNKF